MTCRLVVVGLVLLAVFLPLVIPPLATFVLDAPAMSATVAAAAPGHSPVAPLLAATPLRGPPSR